MDEDPLGEFLDVFQATDVGEAVKSFADRFGPLRVRLDDASGMFRLQPHGKEPLSEWRKVWQLFVDVLTIATQQQGRRTSKIQWMAGDIDAARQRLKQLRKVGPLEAAADLVIAMLARSRVADAKKVAEQLDRALQFTPEMTQAKPSTLKDAAHDKYVVVSAMNTLIQHAYLSPTMYWFGEHPGIYSRPPGIFSVLVWQLQLSLARSTKLAKCGGCQHLYLSGRLPREPRQDRVWYCPACQEDPDVMRAIQSSKRAERRRRPKPSPTPRIRLKGGRTKS